MPLAATTTKLHITSNATSPTNGAAKDGRTSKNGRDPFRELDLKKGSSTANTAPEDEKSEDEIPDNASTNRDTRPESKSHAPEVHKAANDSTGWLNWFSKSEIATENEISIAQPDGDISNVSNAGKNRPQANLPEALRDAPTCPSQRRNSEPSPVSPNVQQQENPRSWLSLWGNGSTQTKSSSSACAFGAASNPQSDSNGTGPQAGKPDDAEFGPGSTSQPARQPADGVKSSYGWTFWSRDQPKSDDERTSPESEVGELALAGSSSQSKPESATVDEARGVPSKVGKRQRPQSVEVVEDLKKPRGTGDDAKKDSNPEATPSTPKLAPKADIASQAKRTPENLLLPSFKRTYSSAGRPSLIQQVSRLLQLSSPSESKHVDIIQNPPRIKRALAIVSLA